MDKSIKRGLVDRIYEKRKATALELERIVSDALQNNDTDTIRNIIKQLRNEFAYNIHEPQARYGGLIGLAAIAIGLGSELPFYLNSIIHPVIACFGDNDSNVRYYASEALYNIAKVAKGEILLYFNEIFDISCKLVADPDNSVKNGADILDRLIKDIVCEKATNYVSVLTPPDQIENVKNSTVIDKDGNHVQFYDPQTPKAFSIAKFIPLLKERIYATNTYTRLYIVSWLILLYSIPDLELISYLPSFFDPLLIYLKSPLNDVKVITENFLKLLLQEIKKIHEIKTLKSKKDLKLNSAVNKDKETDEFDEDEDEDLYSSGQNTVIDYAKIIDILVNNLESNDILIKSTCLEWLINLLEISPESFYMLIPKLLVILLNIISTDNSNLTNVSLDLNSKLATLVSLNQHDINLSLLTNNLLMELSSSSNITSQSSDLKKLYAFDWLIMLQNKDPDNFMELTDNIFKILLKTLNGSNEMIINKVLNLLSKILNTSNEKYFNKFMIELLNLLKNDTKLLDSKSDFIIKKICKYLNSERVFVSISNVLLENFENDFKFNDLNFVSIVIQILNNNLIIAPELTDLRKNLIQKSKDSILFENLFKCWCLNSPSLLCLTLLTSRYELSYKIINQMVKYEININILIQLDLLIQLLESPIFAKLRLDLLDPVTNKYLYKCLYGLLMLLPQSNSFKILQNRLSSISSIVKLKNEGNVQSHDYTKENDVLLNYFNKCQEKLQELKEESELSADNAVPDHLAPHYVPDFFKNDLPLETSSIKN